MNNFIIVSNEYLKVNIQAYYGHDYTTFGTYGNPDFINHLKNTFNNTHYSILQDSQREIFKILHEDLPQIINIHKDVNLIVCVIPRAKAESNYSYGQMLFRNAISSVVNDISNLANGTSYIIRKINTRTTHMDKSGRGGDGEMPYVGITKATCEISGDVCGKDILLIDDIYTFGVNIDEDAIQALLDVGAKSVIFYSVAKTYKGGAKPVIRPQIKDEIPQSL